MAIHTLAVRTTPKQCQPHPARESGVVASRGDFGVYAGFPRAGELRGPHRHVQTPAVPEILVILTNFGATLADFLRPDPLSVSFPYINFTDFDGIYAGGPRSPRSHKA